MENPDGLRMYSANRFSHTDNQMCVTLVRVTLRAGESGGGPWPHFFAQNKRKMRQEKKKEIKERRDKKRNERGMYCLERYLIYDVFILLMFMFDHIENQTRKKYKISLIIHELLSSVYIKFRMHFSQSRAQKFQKFSWPVGPNHGGASLVTISFAPPPLSKPIHRP